MGRFEDMERAWLREPEVKPISACDVCGEPIFEGEDIYVLDEDTIHRDCLRDWAESFEKTATESMFAEY